MKTVTFTEFKEKYIEDNQLTWHTENVKSNSGYALEKTNEAMKNKTGTENELELERARLTNFFLEEIASKQRHNLNIYRECAEAFYSYISNFYRNNILAEKIFRELRVVHYDKSLDRVVEMFHKIYSPIDGEYKIPDGR
jgi:hypothetical protein